MRPSARYAVECRREQREGLANTLRRGPKPRLSVGTQRGAALLMAMLLLTLVATLASGMVWQQWRSVQVEAAERARMQAAWILNGALDWARLILREDARSGRPTALTEVWATPLAEARLSSFLAADRDNNADADLDAFLAGSITDAQSRYNLRNLLKDGKVVPAELAVLARLCESAGVPGDVAERIAQGLSAAATMGAQSPMAPRTLAQLEWLDIESSSIERLQGLVELLPVPTAVNLNTATATVLSAVIEGLDSGSAERLVQARQQRAFKVADEARAYIPGTIKLDPNRVGTLSQYFEVRGRLRMENRILEERSLVERRSLDITVVLRERVGSVLPRP